MHKKCQKKKKQQQKDWENAETNAIKIDTLHWMEITLTKIHFHISYGNFSGKNITYFIL